MLFLSFNASGRKFRDGTLCSRFVFICYRFRFRRAYERIKVVIEEPIAVPVILGYQSKGLDGVPEGVGRYYMDVFIDGEFAFYMAPFGNRPDVGNAFPDYPNSNYGGFSTAYNYKNLDQGQHEIQVRVFDDAGNYNDASVTFTTEKFKSSFIASEDSVDLSTAHSTAWYD